MIEAVLFAVAAPLIICSQLCSQSVIIDQFFPYMDNIGLRQVIKVSTYLIIST